MRTSPDQFRRITRCLLAWLTLAAIPAAAFAQRAAPARLDVQPGQFMWVTLDDGAEQSGRVAHVTASGIEFDRTAAVAPTPWTRIRAIQIPDRLDNGMAIGAAIGFAGLGGAAALVTAKQCANEGGRCGLETLGRLGLFGVAGAGAGMGVGALVDALCHHRQTIYERRLITIAAAPAVSRESSGVSLAIRW
jgi:hypothetical protein